MFLAGIIIFAGIIALILAHDDDSVIDEKTQRRIEYSVDYMNNPIVRHLEEKNRRLK